MPQDKKQFMTALIVGAVMLVTVISNVDKQLRLQAAIVIAIIYILILIKNKQ